MTVGFPGSLPRAITEAEVHMQLQAAENFLLAQICMCRPIQLFVTIVSIGSFQANNTIQELRTQVGYARPKLTRCWLMSSTLSSPLLTKETQPRQAASSASNLTAQVSIEKTRGLLNAITPKYDRDVFYHTAMLEIDACLVNGMF